MVIGTFRYRAALLAMLAWGATAGLASGGVLAPDVPVDGASQAAWGDRWWQWAMSFPAGSNPMTDPTGEFSGLGDLGRVFILSGTVSGPANRTATIREDQTLLIPIAAVVSPIPLFGPDVPAVRADAAATMGTASNLFLTVDGSPASLPASAASLLDFYQTTPPGTFPLTFVEHNIFSVAAATYDSVAVGYFVMLDGLSAGVHQLHFGGHFSGTPSLDYAPFDVDVTYTLNVVPEPSSAVLAGLAGLVLAAGSALRRRHA